MGAVAGATLPAAAPMERRAGLLVRSAQHTLKYAGWGEGFDDVRFEAGEDGAFVASYGRGGELVGVLAHEDDEAYETGQRRIEERASWE